MAIFRHFTPDGDLQALYRTVYILQFCKVSVFLLKVFLRPWTQVCRFGRNLNALDDFFVYNFDANL